ncbi:MAG: hypothetical protein O3B01_17140 [Planctomycetota bacterium]|nr:hypothetical protein [Planctomycetota bacterium]
MNWSLATFFILVFLPVSAGGTDTLPMLKDGRAPQSLEELWAGYDPTREPLEVYEGMKSYSYYAAKPIAKSDGWQTLEISTEDLLPMDERSPKGLRSWQYMTTFGIVANIRARKGNETVVLAGSQWPEQRKLQNLRWVGGECPKTIKMPGTGITADEFHKIFDKEIDKSVEQEKRDADQE